MAETKKYLDFIGLQNYHTKVKALIDEKETAGVAQTKANEALESAKSYADTKVKDLADGAVASNTAAIGVLNGSDTTPGSVAKAVKDEADRAKAAEQANANAIKAISDDYLKASDKTELNNKITAEKEAREAADLALDTRLQKTEAFFVTAEGETLNTALDTLVEIQNYITTEGAAADQMVKDIAANTAAIAAEKTRAEGAESALSGRISTLEAIDHDAYIDADTTLKEELTTEINKKANQTTVDALDTAYKAADTALDGRISTLETAVGKGGSVADQIATAKQEAIDAAAADATAKANTAETNAKTHANGLNTAMSTRVDALEASTHTHSNKALLDTYTQTETDIADAVAKKHSHANATTLAGISDEDVSKWNTVDSKASQSALEAEVTRAKAAEEANAAAIAAFTAITNTEIDSLFTPSA